MGITRRRKVPVAKEWCYRHLSDCMEFCAISSRSMLLVDRSKSSRWTVRASTRATIIWLERLAAFFVRKSSNHSRFLHLACTSLHIAIRNTDEESRKRILLGRMALKVWVIFLRGKFQSLFLRYCRRSWPFLRCRRTWEYQFRPNSWQCRLFFVEHLVISRDRIHLHRPNCKGSEWK